MSNTQEVKISKADIDTLASIYPINQSLKIVGGNPELRCFNTNKTTAVIAKLEQEFPRTFCIYDLREFLSVVGLFDAPTLDFTNPKFVMVKSSDGKQKLKYLDGDATIITSHFEKDLKLNSVDIDVSVTGAQLNAVMRAAQTLKLQFVGFKSIDDKIVLTAFDKNNGSGEETNGFSIEVGETTETFDMFYKTESLTVLTGDCKFEVSKSKVSRIENAGKVLFISLDATRQYN
jgi:hypothetical protein